MLIGILIGTAMGFLAGLGVGGGSLLLLWLTLCLNFELETARMINLLFFLPSALIACCFRWKQGRITWKKIFPAMIAGCLSALVFSWLGKCMDLTILKKLFGSLLIFTGIREITYRPRKLR